MEAFSNFVVIHKAEHAGDFSDSRLDCPGIRATYYSKNEVLGHWKHKYFIYATTNYKCTIVILKSLRIFVPEILIHLHFQKASSKDRPDLSMEI